MHDLIVPFGFGFLGLGLVSTLASVAYPLFVAWMIVDGFLRTDAEYPGVEPNRKVLWVVAMILLNPVAFLYFLLVFLKVKRGSSTAYVSTTPGS